jgi:hypothetical protein
VGPDCLVNVNLDYATTDALFASTCQGIYRWTGSKWSLLSDLTRAVAVTYRQPSNLWASTSRSADGPVAHSTDGGATWQSASAGLVHFNGVADVGIDPRDARTLYAIIMPKYGGSYLRRKTGDNQWETMPTPLNNAQIDVGMTIDGATGALYVTAYDGTTTPGRGHWQVWRSPNPTVEMNNVKWEKVHDFGEMRWATMLASGWSPQGLALCQGDSDHRRISRFSFTRRRQDLDCAEDTMMPSRRGEAQSCFAPTSCHYARTSSFAAVGELSGFELKAR